MLPEPLWLGEEERTGVFSQITSMHNPAIQDYLKGGRPQFRQPELAIRVGGSLDITPHTGALRRARVRVDKYTKTVASRQRARDNS